MDNFQIHRNLMEFTILKNGKLDWKGKFNLSLSGFGFTAVDADNNEYGLLSSGILFWRKLTLLKNGSEIDVIKVNRSKHYPIVLRGGMTLYINNKEVASAVKPQTDSEYGQVLLSWENEQNDYKDIIYALMLACIQNSARVYVN